MKNEIKNQEGGRDLAMSDYFKTLREPLIEQQEKKREKQDEIIKRLKDNEERIIQAIEYNPQRAQIYEGETLPKRGWEGKKGSEYAFIDKDDEEEEEIDKEDEENDWEESSDEEEDKEKPRTSKTSKKTVILNLDKGINNEYRTLLKNKGYDLPSEIFNEQKNVDDIIKKNLRGK